MTGSSPLNLIASTAFGLEAIVKRELLDLGYDGKVVGPGRVLFQGDKLAICRTNLWLRTADRVLLQMASFPAMDFDALFETAKATQWHQWVTIDAEFPVVGRSIKSQLSSVPACQRAVKKAIVESLRTAYHTEELPETGPLYKVEVSILRDHVTLTIDTTGPSLHKRGYRRLTQRAPLKETLAAAMVVLSFWNRDRPLIDPFCGSGTIPIEAALLGRNLAPGLQRTFSCETWPNLAGELWREARSEARDLEHREPFERLVGTDIDGRALDLARENAQLAGVHDQLHFQERPFDRLTSKRQFGCVITNPPYGRRLGEESQWEPLYRSMPEVLRKLPSWSHFILTAFPDLESLLGRKAERRRKLYNGRIECTFYQFHGPRPESSRRPAPAADEAAPDTDELPGDSERAPPPDPESDFSTPPPPERLPPVFGGLSEKAHEQAALFSNRLKKLARHLRRWPSRRNVTCYRLYDRDIPEIPLVVDRYEDHLHITEYERPHDRDLAQHADWLDLMTRTASTTLEVDRRNVFLKRKLRQRGTTQHERLSERQYEITVQEGGLKFIVNLSDYIDTGLFLDHRVTRAMVRELADGANVLNLFGYTGTFSVYAASGAARRTTTVDWSRNYLDWAQRNMALNGFSGNQHRFVREDARAYLRHLPAHETFDLAIVDPPTFSNSKRTEEDWNIQRDHAELLAALLHRMKPQGVVFFSTNFRRFKLEPVAQPTVEIREVSQKTVPEDFRNQRIHRCWKIVVGQ